MCEQGHILGSSCEFWAS